jgi:predicted RNase H-like HicB family nuclease
MNNHNPKSLFDYLSLPYKREFLPNDDGTWFGKITELSGCMTEGNTPSECWENLEDALSSWLETCLESGSSIPLPEALL